MQQRMSPLDAAFVDVRWPAMDALADAHGVQSQQRRSA